MKRELDAGECPVCDGPLSAAPTGRPRVYCGTPCRQAAHRARRAAERAAEHAAWLRQELAGVGSHGEQIGLQKAFHQEASTMIGAFERIHDYPLPTGDSVPSGWESGFIDQADKMRRLASRAYDLAVAHARAAGEFSAARAMSGLADE